MRRDAGIKHLSGLATRALPTAGSKSSGKSLTLHDVEIGQRVKILRKMRGMSLMSLGRHLGVTFQQVQKYECGTNRLSATRLATLATVLDVSIFDILSPDAATSDRDTNRDLTALLSCNETLALARAFTAIQSQPVRKSVLAMVQAALDIEAAAREPDSQTRAPAGPTASD